MNTVLNKNTLVKIVIEKEILNKISAANLDDIKFLDGVIQEKNALAYQQFANDYVNFNSSLPEALQQKLTDLFNLAKEQTNKAQVVIADIGAGPAIKSSFLNNFTDSYCLAIEKCDIFFPIIESQKVPLFSADMANLPLPDASVDLALHHATLHHCPLFESNDYGVLNVMKETTRVLSKGAILDIVLKYGDNFYFDKSGRFFQEYTEDSAKLLVSNLPLNIIKNEKFTVPDKHADWASWLHLRLQKTK